MQNSCPFIILTIFAHNTVQEMQIVALGIQLKLRMAVKHI